MLGVLLVGKPLGITSHDVVNQLRRKFSMKRIGHAGTLDPLATGLLVVAIGPATRFLQYLPLEPKEYIAEIRFGIETASFDREGDVVRESQVPDTIAEDVAAQLPMLTGLIQQIPPMYSAVKMKGQPLYKLARSGKEVEREPRTVHIGAFEILSRDSKEVFRARIECSGGTYIRTLAHDLGRLVGCGAHLSSLTRTRVGNFSLQQANSLADCRADDLIPLGEAIAPMPKLTLDGDQVRAVREGRPIYGAETLDAKLIALAEPDGNVFSVARVAGNLLQPECVIPSEARL
jgi:tRNA pseudouridine55 synthase